MRPIEPLSESAQEVLRASSESRLAAGHEPEEPRVDTCRICGRRREVVPWLLPYGTCGEACWLEDARCRGATIELAHNVYESDPPGRRKVNVY